MARYPNISGSDDFSVELLRSMLPDIVRKTSATTRSSTTTATDDPDLSLAVVANGVYLIEFVMRPGALAAADFKTQWSSPSGTTGNRSVNGPGSTALDSNADNITSKWGVHGLATAITYNGVRDGSNQFWCREWAIVTIGSTAGNVALQWAQGTSNATGTTLNADSYGMSIRLA